MSDGTACSGARAVIARSLESGQLLVGMRGSDAAARLLLERLVVIQAHAANFEEIRSDPAKPLTEHELEDQGAALP